LFLENGISEASCSSATTSMRESVLLAMPNLCWSFRSSQTFRFPSVRGPMEAHLSAFVAFASGVDVPVSNRQCEPGSHNPPALLLGNTNLACV
jgi:hypothetical protein